MTVRPSPPAARAPSLPASLPQAGERSRAPRTAPRPLAGEGGPKGRERAAPQARKARRVALERAKTLRAGQTDAELRLWHHLRAGRFLDLKFKRQHPVGPYIADFVCLSCRLIVEADGGQHNPPGTDAVRDQFLQQQGYRVVRFWNDDVLKNTDAVLEAIRLAVGEAPSPRRTYTFDPLPQAGEGNRD